MLVGYVITLAPTVTLWDAGEFITAAKVLGVPHPPGTPLFVMLGHVWADVVRIGGAAAAALFSAFSFTNWQNSNETEVYTVATFSIAAICWLCLRWRDVRGTPEAPHLQLLIVYVAALSIGNHLLALLVGPAVALFIAHTLRTQPAADARERNMEWAEWSALTALWIVLIAVGLGSTVWLIVGGILLLAAVVACVRQGSVAFPLLAIGIAAVGISTYAFLYIRSGLQPLLDEANPETWKNLIAVIRREQFGTRGLLDNPTVAPGPENPGRTLTMVGMQFVNYFQYCAWQWGRALPLPATAVLVFVFVLLGVFGFDFARQRDAGIAQLLLVLWLITGVGLVIYMNFKPGFSLFWNQFKTMDQHEVRERDYFFVASFQMWGVFAGLGLVRFLRLLARAGPVPRWAIALGALVTLLPFAANFTAASRRHGADAYAARDFAYNLLQSVEPYGVLFGFGDNDTFPVWYLQEVEGVRQDVTQINLSLANLDWYVQQLASRPVRPFDPARAPAMYRALAPPTPPTGPALALTPAEIADMAPVPVRDDGVFQLGPLQLPIRKGMFLRTADQVILYTLATHLPRNRAVTFGVSSGRGSWLGLDPHLVFRGLVFKVAPRADTVRTWLNGVQNTMVDSATTRRLVDSVFQYGKFFSVDSLVLEPAAEQVARSFSVSFIELANAAALRGDQPETIARLRRAHHLNPTPALREVIRRVETEGVQSLYRRP